MTSFLYIGENPNYITHFSRILEGKTFVKKDKQEAVSYLSTCGSSKISVLYEKTDIFDDLPYLSILKKNNPNIYLILVADSFNKEDNLAYLKVGVNNTIPSDADTKKIQNVIDYVGWLEKLSSQPKSTFNLSKAKKYKTPRGKRLFDIVVSLLALTVLSPILLLIAIFIKCESKGSILYKSKRVGSQYVTFDFYKFRTMYTGADAKLRELKDLNQYKSKEYTEPLTDNENEQSDVEDIMLISDDTVISEHNYIYEKKKQQKKTFIKYIADPRITKTGHFLRKYSLDELPQLFNILKGDMSIVGNRPLPPYEAEFLTDNEYADRFIAPAGLTGLWQVEKRGDGGSMSSEERKQLDIYYANNYSVLLDIHIIIKTFFTFIQKEDV